MRCFTYSTAETVDTAITEMDRTQEAKFLAGGTNLIDLMKENVERPGHLIAIKNLPYNRIEANGTGGLRLGAMVSNADTAYHPEVETRYPLLSQTILAGASPQLRNMATNGGNLLQRTRCYYFYDIATPCNKREPGTGCSAIKGYNRIHAILGASEDCIAVFPSDMCNALAALEAVVVVKGSTGERTIPFEEFHRLPGNTPDKDNNLGKDEVILAIDLPEKGFAANYNYLKLRDRSSYAFALVSVAVGLELEGDSIREARIVIGGVAHKPWRNKAAEQSLVGKSVTRENFSDAAAQILAEAKGFEHNIFKINLAQRAIVRSLEDAVKKSKP